MHTIEPHFNWRDQYTAEHDKQSPFYGNTYNEFVFDKQIYNYFIHPQWDEIGSQGLFVKLLFTEYSENYAIIELFGEWNDGIDNDIMLLRQELLDPLLAVGISKFIFIGENILNFHGIGDDYYEEFWENVQELDGWLIGINFREHIIDEMDRVGINQYIQYKEPFNDMKWRPYKPEELYQSVETLFGKWLDDGIAKLT